MLQFYSHSVGEDPRVDTNLQEGALWKAIIILVRHTWLRVQGPARRKGANDEIPGGRRDEILPQRHHYSGQWLKVCPKLVDTGAPLPTQGHIRPFLSVHVPASLLVKDGRLLDMFVKMHRIKEMFVKHDLRDLPASS